MPKFFHFGSTPTHFYLFVGSCLVEIPETPRAELTDEQKRKCIEHWPKSGYSIQKARSRADRFVGEYVRREAPESGQLTVSISYTSERFEV